MYVFSKSSFCAVFFVLLSVSFSVLVLARTDVENGKNDSKSIETHRHFKLLPTHCGKSYSTDRIIGGREVQLGQYPWLVRLGYKLSNCTNKILYRCGGTLINHLYVLSAGHCVADLPHSNCPVTSKKSSFIFVNLVLGEHNAKTNPDCVDGTCAKPIQVFKPKRVLLHGKYNKPTFANDISLIRLNRPAELNGWVNPICLPRGKQLSSLYLGKLSEVAGWGATDMEKVGSSNVPMFVKLPIVKVEQCVRSFSYPLILNETGQMCAGGQVDKDSCDGDSGAPLMIVEAYDKEPRYFALGLVSFGAKHCGNKDKPAIYTRIAGYMHWILNNMKP